MSVLDGFNLAIARLAVDVDELRRRVAQQDELLVNLRVDLDLLRGAATTRDEPATASTSRPTRGARGST